MNMQSIVNELAFWVASNRQLLNERGVELVEHFPGHGPEPTWKASIGLVFGDILVSYTVWERTVFQTELLVFNGRRDVTIIMDDLYPEDASIVQSDLNDVMIQLLDGTYDRMEPDPKLIQPNR